LKVLYEGSCIFGSCGIQVGKSSAVISLKEKGEGRVTPGGNGNVQNDP